MFINNVLISLLFSLPATFFSSFFIINLHISSIPPHYNISPYPSNSHSILLTHLSSHSIAYLKILTTLLYTDLLIYLFSIHLLSISISIPNYQALIFAFDTMNIISLMMISLRLII